MIGEGGIGSPEFEEPSLGSTPVLEGSLPDARVVATTMGGAGAKIHNFSPKYIMKDGCVSVCLMHEKCRQVLKEVITSWFTRKVI